MSLTEKEYVASRIYESGVLIVPEFSDSARELREALRVNPYDIDTTVGALERALEMNCVEQRFRMRSLRARVVRNDARRWAQQLIADLLQRPCTPASGKPEELLLKQLTELRYTLSLSLFLAYDGALVPFAPLPELAAPDPEAYRLLEQLAKERRLRVHLVSGRPRGELEAWFGELPIALHAEHGYWSRLGPGQAWIAAGLLSTTGSAGLGREPSRSFRTLHDDRFERCSFA